MLAHKHRCAIVVFGLFALPLLLAAAPIPQSDIPPDLPALVLLFISQAGFAGIVAAVINGLKTFGVVKDGQAPTWSLAINALGFAGFVALVLFAPGYDIAGLDSALGTVGEILALALGLFIQLGGSKLVHAGVRGAPVIGKSFTHPA